VTAVLEQDQKNTFDSADVFLQIYICSLKAYIVSTFEVRKINLSGITPLWVRSQPIRTKSFTKSGHEIESRSNRHVTQSRLQVRGCSTERYVVVQGSGSFRGVVNLFCTTYGCYKESKLPNFFGFWSIFFIQNSWKYQPTAQALHRRMITIFPCSSRRSKEVPSGSVV